MPHLQYINGSNAKAVHRARTKKLLSIGITDVGSWIQDLAWFYGHATEDTRFKIFIDITFPLTIKSLTDKFDVLCGRLLGNHNDFHWQLGGQINHQPCSYKAARVIRCTELHSAVSSF